MPQCVLIRDLICHICCVAQRVAIAAMWLASKLEEAPKKFRDVLLVFARIDSRAEGRAPELLDPFSQANLVSSAVSGSRFAVSGGSLAS